MNLDRLSKKSPHVDSRRTLNELHENKLKEFEEQYRTLPEQENKLKKLVELYESNSYSGNYFDLYDEINSLREYIIKVKNKEYECEYLMSAAPYLMAYGGTNTETNIESDDSDDCDSLSSVEDYSQNDSNLDMYVNREIRSKKGEICEMYIQECLNGSKYQKQKQIEEKLFCDCGGSREINLKEAIASCTECGLCVSYQDDQTHPQYSDEIEIMSPFAYKRINHFKEWLAQIQAKETTIPDQDVIDKILVELKKERITDVTKINNKLIKRYLKKLRLNNYYENVTAIIYKISGIPPPSITKDLEEKLINMFHEIQIPFEKHCPKDRKNFLSYSYTLHKMCQLLGEDELADCFDLLKSREKLYFQDKIWKGICNSLGWEFFPSL